MRIKKIGHRVFANGCQIRAVQCLLQGRVCSDVALHLDFAQFQSLQNGNFSTKGGGSMESYEKSFGKAQPDENAPSARLKQMK